MRQIEEDSLCSITYQYLKKDADWVAGFEDFLKGTKSLPLLYDPFFKKIFNPVERRDRLSELVSCLLGQKGTVLEVLPNEDSQFLGVMIIMDMVVQMSDGSIANIEIQKISYDFPAERISCYSADLVLRQYKMITGEKEHVKDESKKASYRAEKTSYNAEKASYKDMRKVHTIILFEESNGNLISEIDKALYFHVGKTTFNTGIKIELLQDFVLVSLDTFRKYRYADVSEGRVEITDYDYDRTQYDDKLVTDKMKRDRLKYLSLFVAATSQEIDNLVGIFPDLEPIRRDINEFLERPKEVIGMFSEALRILDRNTAELMVDRMKNEMVVLKGQNDELVVKNDELVVKNDELGAKNNELTGKVDELKAEKDELKQKLKNQDELQEQKDKLQAEVERLRKLLEEQNK